MERIPDIVKKATFEDGSELYLAFLILENQDGVAYDMPLRDLGNCCMAYKAQYDNLRKMRKKDGSINKGSSDEYRSHILKDDRLFPVLHLTVYWGTKEWDGPKSPEDMLAMPEEAKKAWTQKWPIRLVEARKNDLPLTDDWNQALFAATAANSSGKPLRERFDALIKICSPYANDEELIDTMEAAPHAIAGQTCEGSERRRTYGSRFS